MSKLLPCPFCACDGTREPDSEDDVLDVFVTSASGLHHVDCPDCGARGPVEISDDEAREIWNRRAYAEDLAARLDEAVGLLRKFAATTRMSGAHWDETRKFLAAIDAESAGGTR